MTGLYVFIIILFNCVVIDNYLTKRQSNNKQIETLTNLIESVNKTNQELQEKIDSLEQTPVETTPKKSKIYKKKLY